MSKRPLPADLGYRMPAEWEPHEATWLAWPHKQETWPGQDLGRVEDAYVEMILALSPGETVHVLVNDTQAETRARKKILARNDAKNGHKSKAWRFHVIPTNDAWMRDYGPNFIVNDENKTVAFNKWEFNSWGGKYECPLDNAAGHRIAELLGCETFVPDIVLEGGAIDVNGQGICLTTEQCLLNPTRNKGMERKTMEALLRNHLGVETVVWCRGEIVGDDTDGHIDNLVRFVAPDTVLSSWNDDPADPNTKCLQENFKILSHVKDRRGRPLAVHKLPMPYVEDAGERLPASHANFYIGNRAVLLPVYGQESDVTAATLLGRFFPDREIVGIDCKVFIWGLGAMHCVTQQQPAAPK